MADLRSFARQLRHGETDAERVLWSKLRARRLLGLKFRRQAPIGPYIADFACFERKVVVELDGGHHAEPAQAAHDERRTQWLIGQGFRVLRFWDNEVLREPEAVLERIRQVCEGDPSSPSP
ncbi:MAG: endonuclease domain-containing protein [Firmicutes bacterium]|nr:endonuclease domain-containing protein [Bacillota bacterium]